MATDPGDEGPGNSEVEPLPSSVEARSAPGDGAEARFKTKSFLSVKRDVKCPVDNSANGGLQINNSELDSEGSVSGQSLKSYPDTLCNGTNAKGKTPTPSDTGLINLILQFLKNSGFLCTAECLIRESNLNVEKYAASEFRRSVLSGMWSEAEGLLPLLGITGKNLETVQLLLHEQKYLELLETNDALGALSVLRNQLASSEIDPIKFERLSSLIMCLGAPDGFIKIPSRNMSSTDSRGLLLKNLQELIPSVVEISQNRLKVLIDQAIKYQISNCIYHVGLADSHTGLYSDHICNRISFPATTCCVLERHTDEVWFVSFSHNNLYLASASKDKTAIVWSMERMNMLYLLTGHAAPVSSVAWSYDDTKLLTVSNDNALRLWDMKTGSCTATFRVHTADVTSCAWLPSGEKFVSGSVDKNVCICSTDGSLVHVWSGIRANDMSVTRDGKTLIVASERYIRLFDLYDKSMIGLFAESDLITSINMSSHTGYVLINLLGDAIHLWDFENRSMVKRYTGPSNKRFIIRSCFGGNNDQYILSGSEDCKVYVWHREKGALIEVLSGHTGVVNCVSWCSSKTMFASASDDHTIRIWGNSLNPLYNDSLYTQDNVVSEHKLSSPTKSGA